MLPAVLETSGVEVPAGVEPEPELGVEEPVGAEVVALEPEPEAEVEAAPEAEDDSVVPALLELVSLAEVEAGPELLVEVLALSEEEVRIGASEIGTPAEEHWATTILETASVYISK